MIATPKVKKIKLSLALNLHSFRGHDKIVYMIRQVTIDKVKQVIDLYAELRDRFAKLPGYTLPEAQFQAWSIVYGDK